MSKPDKSNPSVTTSPFSYGERQRTPDGYQCGQCKAIGVRLYREYNTFLSHQALYCRACAIIEAKRDSSSEKEMATPSEASIGRLIAAVPTEDGTTYWGFTSVPMPGVEWWNALPKVKALKRMVAGFLIRRTGPEPEIALILKARPDWQKGKLNGVGGKVEAGEDEWQAMAREFFEEVELAVNLLEIRLQYFQWRRFCSLWEGDHVVSFFAADCPEDARIIRGKNDDEPVAWFRLSEIMRADCRPPVIPNLRWLIPMAMDAKTYVDAFTP